MKPLSFVLQYARRHVTPLIVTVIAMLLLVGVQLLNPWIIKTMVGTITDSGVTPEALRTVSRLALLALVSYLARAVLQFTRSYMAHVAGWRVVAETQRHIYEHLQRLSLRFYEDTQTGELMSRAINDTRLFEQLIAHRLSTIRSADLICVLKETEIVEMGNHEELMRRAGLYRRLNEVQIEDEPKWRQLREQRQRLMANA